MSRKATSHNGEAVFFYFLTVEDAKAFIDRFACGLSVQGEWEVPTERCGRF